MNANNMLLKESISWWCELKTDEAGKRFGVGKKVVYWHGQTLFWMDTGCSKLRIFITYPARPCLFPSSVIPSQVARSFFGRCWRKCRGKLSGFQNPGFGIKDPFGDSVCSKVLSNKGDSFSNINQGSS